MSMSERGRRRFLAKTGLTLDVDYGIHTYPFAQAASAAQNVGAQPLRAVAGLGTLLSTRHRAGCDEPPLAIAEHLESGGMLPQASAYWLRAGRLASAAGDAKTAIERFTQVIKIERERSDIGRSAASSNR